MHLSQMFEAIEQEELTTLYVIGENPAQSEADQTRAVNLLSSLECLVVQDVFLTKTAQLADVVLPEVPKLRLEMDEHLRHKDVYQHSLTVLEQAIGLEDRYGLHGDLVVRLAALLHDIGKPKTRALLPDGRVAFHHHEVVGEKMARARLKALRFPSGVIADVSTLIGLHLRFHGYGEGEWTDAAVRRYVRDAGPLLTRARTSWKRVNSASIWKHIPRRNQAKTCG